MLEQWFSNWSLHHLEDLLKQSLLDAHPVSDSVGLGWDEEPAFLTSSLVLIWGQQVEGHCSRPVVSTVAARDNKLGSFLTPHAQIITQTNNIRIYGGRD